MSFLKLVHRRRSCRRYTDRPVSRESLCRCLEAARLAPSACNAQPWRFIVVEDGPLRKKLAQAAFSGTGGMNAFAKEAPALVVVVRETMGYASLMGAAFKGTPYSLIDLGIACEHFILQAEEEGLGTCWIGWFNKRRVERILNVPFYRNIDIIISVGRPAEGLDPKKKRKELFEIGEFR